MNFFWDVFSFLGSPVSLLGNAKTMHNNMVNNDDEKE
jgi:hypothetical protein